MAEEARTGISALRNESYEVGKVRGPLLAAPAMAIDDGVWIYEPGSAVRGLGTDGLRASLRALPERAPDRARVTSGDTVPGVPGTVSHPSWSG